MIMQSHTVNTPDGPARVVSYTDRSVIVRFSDDRIDCFDRSVVGTPLPPANETPPAPSSAIHYPSAEAAQESFTELINAFEGMGITSSFEDLGGGSQALRISVSHDDSRSVLLGSDSEPGCIMWTDEGLQHYWSGVVYEVDPITGDNFDEADLPTILTDPQDTKATALAITARLLFPAAVLDIAAANEPKGI